jgi:hypothetical protein
MPLALAAVAVFMLELFVAQREKGETSG